MEQVSEKNNLVGSLKVYEDFNRGIFLAEPHGIVNPSLVREDLSRAREFSKKTELPWTYITNAEDVDLPNPFNLIYLKEIKKLRGVKAIYVYAPHFFNRMLIRLMSFVVRPDKIIKDRLEFERIVGPRN